jgi:hypothetical protein
MTHIFLNNVFLRIACIIFALTIFKGNDIFTQQFNCVQMLNYFIVFLTLL